MSRQLGERNSVKASKRWRCVLCGESIFLGELYDVRWGVNSDGFWRMEMHPECHAFESPQTVELDWYEDCSEPAFERPDRAGK